MYIFFVECQFALYITLFFLNENLALDEYIFVSEIKLSSDGLDMYEWIIDGRIISQVHNQIT